MQPLDCGCSMFLLICMHSAAVSYCVYLFAGGAGECLDDFVNSSASGPGKLSDDFVNLFARCPGKFSDDFVNSFVGGPPMILLICSP